MTTEVVGRRVRPLQPVIAFRLSTGGDHRAVLAALFLLPRRLSTRTPVTVALSRKCRRKPTHCSRRTPHSTLVLLLVASIDAPAHHGIVTALRRSADGDHHVAPAALLLLAAAFVDKPAHRRRAAAFRASAHAPAAVNLPAQCGSNDAESPAARGASAHALAAVDLQPGGLAAPRNRRQRAAPLPLPRRRLNFRPPR